MPDMSVKIDRHILRQDCTALNPPTTVVADIMDLYLFPKLARVFRRRPCLIARL